MPHFYMIIAGAISLATNMFLAPIDLSIGAENDMKSKQKDILSVETHIEHLEAITSSDETINLTFSPQEEKTFQSLLETKSAALEENSKKHAYDEMKKNDTTGFDFIYKQASERYGIPWQVLSAVHKVETGRRGDTAIGSYAGAVGPMQFLPSTFRRFGVDGDGDGIARITDSDDAIYSAANYLRASGGAVNIRTGLFAYNHSTAYVNKVLGVAHSLGYTG